MNQELTQSELLHMLYGSHEHMVEALLEGDSKLMLASYRNYVRAIALLLDMKERKEKARGTN